MKAYETDAVDELIGTEVFRDEVEKQLEIERKSHKDAAVEAMQVWAPGVRAETLIDPGEEGQAGAEGEGGPHLLEI